MTHPVTPRCYNQCMHTRYSPARVNLVLLILGLACFVSQLPAGAQGKGTFTGIITHVADGDTLSVTANGRTEVIRLDGIDAPEAGQAFGGQARQRLRVLAFSQPATVHVRDRDRYGRLVARVIVGGRDLSEEMVRAGFAWQYTQVLCRRPARRTRTTGETTARRAVGRSNRRSAVAVSQGAFPGRPGAACARSAASCLSGKRPVPRKYLEPRLSRTQLPGLQLPQLHVGVYHSSGSRGSGLSAARRVRSCR